MGPARRRAAPALDENYLPLAARELRQGDLVPPPWTSAQKRFAEARQRVRVIKGFPGSGKTTALWHAADLAGRESILYITYSPELAALARDDFDKFPPGHKRFQVLTYAQMVRRLLGSDAPSSSILGPWAGHRTELFDELQRKPCWCLRCCRRSTGCSLRPRRRRAPRGRAKRQSGL